MAAFEVNFNFSPEILKEASEAQDAVDKILNEVKSELFGSSEVIEKMDALVLSGR